MTPPAMTAATAARKGEDFINLSISTNQHE
jgi:hypothetical protein